MNTLAMENETKEVAAAAAADVKVVVVEEETTTTTLGDGGNVASLEQTKDKAKEEKPLSTTTTTTAAVGCDTDDVMGDVEGVGVPPKGVVAVAKEPESNEDKDEEMDDEEEDDEDRVAGGGGGVGENEGEDSTTASPFRINACLLPFPEKLMSLLNTDDDNNNDASMADSMWWLPDGDSFCLVPALFAERVLDKHFQGTKFESFTRKLNRWGFKRVAGQKVPANTIAYYNKNFLRGKPKLLKSMNGGKTKFITAREKRMRAQIKRERDQEQAVLIAAQQQSLILSDQNQNKNISGGGIGEGSMAATTVRSVGSMRSSPPGLMGGNLDVMQLRALLASSNPMALQQLQQQQLQRVDDLRMADQVFAAKQALAMQHEELQMRLLRQGNNFSNMPFLPDSAVSNQFLSSQNPTLGLHHNNNMNMDASFPGSSLVAMRLSQLQQQQRLLQSGGDSMRVPSSSIGGNDMSAEQLLLARQLSTADAGVAHGNTLSANNWAQRFMSQGGLGGSSSGLLSGLNDSISAGTLTQQGMQEAELLKRAAAADGGNSANPSAEVWASVDQQLLQMYLMQQQRKNEMSALQFNNIRQS